MGAVGKAGMSAMTDFVVEIVRAANIIETVTPVDNRVASEAWAHAHSERRVAEHPRQLA